MGNCSEVLVVKPFPNPDASIAKSDYDFKAVVKNLTDNISTLDVNSCDCIRTVNQKIQDIEVSADQQCIIFTCKQLEDHCSSFEVPKFAGCNIKVPKLQI
jgi:hypothetical protein